MVGLLLSAATGLLSGCADVEWDHEWGRDFLDAFAPKPAPSQAMIIALESERADERRKGVAIVAGSGERTKQWAIDGMTVIALLDTDTHARCIALRGLVAAKAPQRLDTILKIIESQKYDSTEVRPADEVLRADALDVLADELLAGDVPPGREESIRAILLDRLQNEPLREGRVAAARGLAHFADIEVIERLITRLDDAEFAVVWQCEESLVKLTGVTHSCRAVEWRDWLNANRESALARRGEQVASRRPRYTNVPEWLVFESVVYVRDMLPAD
jgi:hypothetical protein